MSRLVRLLCGSVVALVVMAVCFGSLVGQARAAEAPVVAQGAALETGQGPQVTWRRVITPYIVSPLMASPLAEMVQPEGTLGSHHPPELIIRRFISPDIASPLTLRTNDRLIAVRGGIACTRGEQFRVNVVVTQGTTGAYAEGHGQGFCTGEKQVFTLLAVARGSTRFAPGLARAEAFAATLAHGTVTDTHSWWRNVVLVP